VGGGLLDHGRPPQEHRGTPSSSESLTGTTRRAAHLIGDGFYDHQIRTQFFNVNAVDADAVAAADP
jgi:hypothetical protein